MEEMESDDAHVQRQDRGKSLSPKSMKRINQLIMEIKLGKAFINEENGKISVNYHSEARNVMAGKDVSQTETIVSPTNKEEEAAYVEVFSEIIYGMKNLISPRGINFGSKEIYSPNGVYVEEKNFTKTGEILGKGLYGQIVVVKDNKTKQEHALKTVMIGSFNDNELKMWIDLNEEGFVPSLLMVRRQDDKINFHMEKLTEAVTLRKVVDDLMNEIDPKMIKGLSLCVLHGLLTAVDKIHDTNWIHNDIHGGNVMLQKKDSSIDVKIVDFGKGYRMERLTTDDEIKRYKSDILGCFRLFSGMYLGQEFNDIDDVEKNGTAKLTKMLQFYGEEDRKEILQLFDVFLEITSKNSEKFGKTKEVLEKVGAVVEDNVIDKDEMLEYAATILFPEKITPVNSLDLDDYRFSGKESMFLNVMEQETDRVDSVGSTNSNSAEVVREILNELSIRPKKSKAIGI